MFIFICIPKWWYVWPYVIKRSCQEYVPPELISLFFPPETPWKQPLMGNKGVWHGYGMWYSKYIDRNFKPSSVMNEIILPNRLFAIYQLVGVGADIIIFSYFFLHSVGFEGDRVSKTNGDWKGVYPFLKTNNLRLKIGVGRRFVCFFLPTLVKHKDQHRFRLLWISTQKWLTWGCVISRFCIPVWLWKVPKINVQDIHRHLSQYRMRFENVWSSGKLATALLL